MSLRTRLAALLAGDSEPDNFGIGAVYYTPATVKDSGGLFVDREGAAWLYCTLDSSSVQAAAAAFDRALASLQVLGAERDIHLVRIQLPSPVAVPVPTDLCDPAAGSVDAPRSWLMLGVRLLSRATTETFASDLRANVTQALGQTFPDLTLVEPDRGAVEAALSSAGCATLSLEDRRALEWWFTLGASGAVQATERADAITFDSGSRIDLAAVTSLGARDPLACLYAARVPEAACTSVRGTLDAGARTPHLRDASVVLGQRDRVDAPLLSRAARADGLELKALSHRQILALDECLPASAMRVSPFLRSLSSSDLTSSGLLGHGSVGDGQGLYVGMAMPEALPALINPLAPPRRGALNGVAVAGTSRDETRRVLAYLVAQAGAAGASVRVCTDNASTWDALVEHRRARVIRWPALARTKGSLDPFVLLPPMLAARVLLAALAEALPTDTFNTAERAELVTMCQHAIAVKAPTTRLALQHVESRPLRDKVARLCERTPSLWPLYNTDREDTYTSSLLHRADATLVYDLSSAPAAGARLVQRVVSALDSHVVALDCAPSILHASDADDLVARTTSDGRLLLVTWDASDAWPLNDQPSTAVLTDAETGHAAGSLGYPESEVLDQWLAARRAVLASEGHPITPHLLVRDRHGQLGLTKLVGVPSWLH